jgi:hypothetical protein
MAKMTAAERYAARKVRLAVDLRAQTLRAAEAAARRTRLAAKYGPDWRRVLDRRANQYMREWNEIVDQRNRAGVV